MCVCVFDVCAMFALTFCNLQVCGLAGCDKAASKFCAACKTIWYCSVEHQKASWADHKLQCRLLRAKTKEQAKTKAKAENSNSNI